MFRFGLPTMPAELSLYSLNFIDRIIIVRTVGLAEAGLYALAVKFAQAMQVLVRGFQLAWPPLAYSIRDDDEARRAYAAIFTWFAAVLAFAASGLWLLSRWIVRLLAAPDFFDSYEAIGLLATGIALYAPLPGDGRDPRPDRAHRVQLPGDASRRWPPTSRSTSSCPVAWDRRRRARAGRLLRGRPRADVRVHAAALPGPLRVGPPCRWSCCLRRPWSRSASCCCRPPARSACSAAARSGSPTRGSSSLFGFLHEEERAGLAELLRPSAIAARATGLRAAPADARSRRGRALRVGPGGLRGRGARRGPLGDLTELPGPRGRPL